MTLICLNCVHDMWCVFFSKHKWGWDPWWEKLHLFLTYFCILLLLLQCIGMVMWVMILMGDMVRNHLTPAAIGSQLKRKHQIAEACATFQPNVRVRQMMLDVGEGVPRAGVWQDLRSDTSEGGLDGAPSSRQKLRLFSSGWSAIHMCKIPMLSFLFDIFHLCKIKEHLWNCCVSTSFHKKGVLFI